MAYDQAAYKRKWEQARHRLAEERQKRAERARQGISVPMNGTLRAASVPGREYGHPIILVAHADTPAAWLLARAAALRAQSRFAGMDNDRECDPE